MTLSYELLCDLMKTADSIPAAIRAQRYEHQLLVERTCAERSVVLPERVAVDRMLGLPLVVDDAVPEWEAHIVSSTGKLLHVIDLRPEPAPEPETLLGYPVYHVRFTHHERVR